MKTRFADDNYMRVYHVEFDIYVTGRLLSRKEPLRIFTRGVQKPSRLKNDTSFNYASVKGYVGSPTRSGSGGRTDSDFRSFDTSIFNRREVDPLEFTRQKLAKVSSSISLQVETPKLLFFPVMTVDVFLKCWPFVLKHSAYIEYIERDTALSFFERREFPYTVYNFILSFPHPGLRILPFSRATYDSP